MENCSFWEFKDLFFALITPIIQWFVREMMNRIPKDRAEDFLEALFTGLGVLGALYFFLCFLSS